MDKSYNNIPKWSNAKSNTNDPLEFYKEHYIGVTRARLNDLDSNLYTALRKGGYLSEIPRKYYIKR